MGPSCHWVAAHNTASFEVASKHLLGRPLNCLRSSLDFVNSGGEEGDDSSAGFPGMGGRSQHTIAARRREGSGSEILNCTVEQAAAAWRGCGVSGL